MAAEVEDVSDVGLQELEESTRCCICTEIYKCAKLLPCGHTFCMNCIQETGLKTSKGPGDEMPCPICRQRFKIPSNGFTGLQNNYYVEGLIRVDRILNPSVAGIVLCNACLEENEEEEADKEVPRAEMYCCECKQRLCGECCKHHRKVKMTKHHRLISIYEQRPNDEDLIQSIVSDVCELHKQKDLKIYCCVCRTCVCDICFTEHHEGHKGTHVSKAVDDFRKTIADNIETLKTCIDQAVVKKLEIGKSKLDVQEKLVSLEYDITHRKEDLKQATDKHAVSLLEELCSVRQSTMKEISIEIDHIDAQLLRLESYSTYCKKILTKGSAFDICRSVADLSARVNALKDEIQSLTELHLKPLSLCFIKAELEDKDGHNMIGQLKEQYHLKEGTKNRPAEELTQKITKTTPLQPDIEKLASEGKPGHLKVEEKMQQKLTETGNDSAKQKTTEKPNIEAQQLRRSAFKILDQSQDSLLLSAPNSMTVGVKHYTLHTMHHQNTMTVDAFVSYINHELDIDGPVADYLMNIPDIRSELVMEKRRLGYLHTGGLVHTSAGSLKELLKAIIHIVAPQIHEVPPNDHKCRSILRNVFSNCLHHTNETLTLKSVGLPPIGFDLFGAEMVVDCFLDAVEIFASTVDSSSADDNPHPQHLNSIQIMSTDLYCLRTLIKYIKHCVDAQ